MHLFLSRSNMPVAVSTLIEIRVPLVGPFVHAGFPSPADDFIEEMIDLNRELIKNPISTYLWRVVGDCMMDVKIFPGDVVVVDRSLIPKHRDVVLVMVDGEPTLKRLNRRGGVMLLHNENAKLPPFTLAEGTEIAIWGVVTDTIRKIRN
ncbi:MAG: translesion error-prone DNA polymerase V autoproteolytic subunit [Candidatus Devosia phytovorans]|uniref:Translesion error-prone DNA polymerase V autoproteolytic subunit n=1 Tax=Candidatus Devosia phytovorans TaxID=3121372 RepID=A0AAJ6AYW6_9HYPH|nr:translesion error-prone DNA polymerase V autoproteolytic subunit [Devosia sp.]WEK03367.1 MAG: translesion error-prone DNA polymerase V autoproteolytic subunit [Devosia sp.]